VRQRCGEFLRPPASVILLPTGERGQDRLPVAGCSAVLLAFTVARPLRLVPRSHPAHAVASVGLRETDITRELLVIVTLRVTVCITRSVMTTIA
jgi:hypothetical protein